MRSVGPGRGDTPPPNDAARPVALPHGLLAEEILILHRARMLPGPSSIPVIGNSGRRAAARAGQRDQAAVILDEGDEPADHPASPPRCGAPRRENTC